MNFPESVAGAIFSPERTSILLIQRRDVPVWVLPGGGMEPAESPEGAIVREIFEETGFTVKVICLVGHYTPVNRLAKRTNLYECAIQEGEASPSLETKQVRFFPLSSLPPLMPPPYPEWIKDAYSSPPFPIYRELKSVNYRTLAKNFLLHPILVFRFAMARLGFPINS